MNLGTNIVFIPCRSVREVVKVGKEVRFLREDKERGIGYFVVSGLHRGETVRAGLDYKWGTGVLWDKQIYSKSRELSMKINRIRNLIDNLFYLCESLL